MAWKASHENKAPTMAGGVISAEQAAQKIPASEVPQAPSLAPATVQPGATTAPATTVPAAPVVIPPAAPSVAPENNDTGNKDAAKPVEQGSKAA